MQMKISLFLVFLLALPAFATTTITPFGPYDISATQAIIRYTTDQTASTCVFRASEGNSLGTMVNDVNTTLFSGSNAATRTGSVAGSYFVLGTRGYYLASDGSHPSRALAAHTAHIVGVQCGADSEVTATFTTTNAPFATPPEAFQFDSSQFGNYAQCTLPSNQDTPCIDSHSGLKMARLTADEDSADATSSVLKNIVPATPIDPTTAWTTPSNILTTSTSYAVCSACGTTANFLFLPATLNSASYPNPSSYDSIENVPTNIRISFKGYGTNATAGNRVLSACLSTDRGQNCACPAIDLPTFPNGSGSAAVEQFPSSNWPSVNFAEWCATPTPTLNAPNTVTLSGTATVSGGTSVTWASGSHFLTLVPGDHITIAATDCPISSVTDDSHLVLGSACPNGTAAFTATNFGVKLWKKTGTGDLGLNTAKYDIIYNSQYSVPFGGATASCNQNVANTTVTRSGSALGHTQAGYLCVYEDIFGNERLYWLGTNGESRFLSRLTVPAVTGSSGGKDDNSLLPSGCQIFSGISPENPFDATDPNVLYCIGTTSGSTYYVVRKFTYNSAMGGCGYAAWAPDYNLDSDNPCMATPVNLTKASLNEDLASQAVSFDPTFKTSLFGSWASPGPGGGTQMPLSAKANGQDSICWYARLDLTINPPTIVQMISSFRTSPTKYGSCHGAADQPLDTYGRLYLGPTLSTPVIFGLTAIAGLPDTGLNNSYVSGSTCEALGVTNPTYMAEGATGLNCIQITISNLDAYTVSPSMAELTAYPQPKNSTACGGDNSTANCYSQIATLEEGDYFADGANCSSSSGACGLGEQFRLVKKLSSTSWVVQRGVQWQGCNTGKASHTNGWTPWMWVTHNCNTSVFHWFSNSGTILPDLACMNAGHHDILIPFGTTSGTYSQAGYNSCSGINGYNQRIGGFPAQINQTSNFGNAKQYGPGFNGSTAQLDAGSIQSHQSCEQKKASAQELKWCLDGRPLGGAAGGASTLGYQVVTTCATMNTCTASNPAAANVYKVDNMTTAPSGGGSALSTLDRKNLPVYAWSGKNLLVDISGPGSDIAAASDYSFCVSDFAGECISGSSAGTVFMKVPQANTDGTCLTGMDNSSLCWVSAPLAPAVTQYGINVADPDGVYWRKISTFFQGMGWVNNYWNTRPTPDGSLSWTVSRWLNGISNKMMAAILPPWPTISDSTGDAYVPYLVPVTGNAQPNARVRFGYAENGAPTDYNCMPRLEACVTDSVWDGTTATVPFKWSSQAQSLQSCSPTCTIKVPTMIGRTTYMVLEYVDSMGVTQATAALPPITVPFNDVQNQNTGIRIPGSSRVSGSFRQ